MLIVGSVWLICKGLRWIMPESRGFQRVRNGGPSYDFDNEDSSSEEEFFSAPPKSASPMRQHASNIAMSTTTRKHDALDDGDGDARKGVRFQHLLSEDIYHRSSAGMFEDDEHDALFRQ